MNIQVNTQADGTRKITMVEPRWVPVTCKNLIVFDDVLLPRRHSSMPFDDEPFPGYRDGKDDK